MDTGLNSNIGQRLVAVKDHLEGEEVFMANYADGLSDINLHHHIDHFYKQDRIGSFLCVKPSQSFHIVSLESNGDIDSITPVGKSDIWINGGFFVFKNEIFNYIEEGEDLVKEPFYRLIEINQITGYKNPGFWACVDTMKEKKMFDDMYARGETPWAVWENSSRESKQKALAQERNSLNSNPIESLEKVEISNAQTE